MKLRTSRLLVAALALTAVGSLAIRAGGAAHPPTPLKLPRPSMPTPIGVRSLWWVDSSRGDPFVPRRRRELVVTLWYPAARASNQPRARYMPAATARIFEQVEGAFAGTFEALRTHALADAPPARGRHPVIVFSPAFGFTGALYTTLLEDLAAHGYVVASIDPTYEAFAVHFPDGRVARPRLGDDADALGRSLAVRVADARFVLNRLAVLERRGPFAGRLDLDRVGIAGHSIGGAMAVNALLGDRRPRAALDLDGSILGPAVNRRLDRPVMLLTSKGAYGEDPTLQQLWSHLDGPRIRILVAGSGHYTFSDLAVLRPQFGPSVPPGLQYDSVGTIPAGRAVPAVRSVVEAFFDRYLRGRRARLLDRPSHSFSVLRRF